MCKCSVMQVNDSKKLNISMYLKCNDITNERFVCVCKCSVSKNLNISSLKSNNTNECFVCVYKCSVMQVNNPKKN